MAELMDRYASVLFEMSLEADALEEHLAQAILLRARLEKEQLACLLEDPHIPDETKRELLEARFGDQIGDDLMGFLRLSVEKGREAAILPTLSAYIEMGESYRGRAVAYVVSAVALRPDQTDALGALLSRKTGKQVEILAREDPALIGGFYIHLDGRLIDQTVRTRLQNLKESLKRG